MGHEERTDLKNLRKVAENDNIFSLGLGRFVAWKCQFSLIKPILLGRISFHLHFPKN